MNWKRPLPKVPSRLHFYSGHKQTSWVGELRAVVDEKHMVIREWWPTKRRWNYKIELRYSWERGAIQPGPLPTTRAKADADLALQGRTRDPDNKP